MKNRGLKRKNVLITGAGGLIGSQAVDFFSRKGFKVFGIDNDSRKFFFGKEASVSCNIARLKKTWNSYRHFFLDIRDAKKIENIFSVHKFDLIVHAAGQPSHDWAARFPLIDFSINANATLSLLENFKKYSPEGVFIFTSTNKVYGDRPNTLPLQEFKKRYDLKKNHPFYKGIDETMGIDRSKHSLFGASKLAADILVQEYGRYFGLKTVCFRAGCLTGSNHAAVSSHGFLVYLAKCIARGTVYTIFGYKGKQVRDNMHASDFVSAMYQFYLKPKCGEVYNIGGSRFSNISVLEAVEKLEAILGKKTRTEYIHQNRLGDHVWYISDVSKFKRDYPCWDPTVSMDMILEEICCCGHFE
jgi:CDP-paratose 2-epimerase